MAKFAGALDRYRCSWDNLYMSSERRQSQRLSYTLPLRYTRGSQRIYVGQVLDISQLGACLILDAASSSPRHMVLELGGRICLQARVVWSERLLEGHYKVGVVFEGLYQEQVWHLNHYLEEIKARAA